MKKVVVSVMAITLASLGAGKAEKPAKVSPERQLQEKYVQLVDSWAQGIEFTQAEKAAMEAGKKNEDAMMRGPDDPIAKKIIAAGEPSFASVSAVYPGKILDRTLLGTWSDPTKPIGKYTNEFSIYWNGAIAANLVDERHNTVVEFRVGPKNELPGRVRRNFSSIGYEHGYLPIVLDSYQIDGVDYRQTAFAWKPEGQTNGWDVAYVCFEVVNNTTVTCHANISAHVILIDGKPVRFAAGNVVDSSGAILLSADEHAKFSEGSVKWDFDLAPAQARHVYCKIPYLPDAKHLLQRASDLEFGSTHDAAAKFWQGLLDEGASIETPEARVNNVWRSLLLQNYVLADGPRFTYGSGLWYNESTYPYENGFATHTFAMYGHGTYADALQEWFLKMCVTPAGAGRKYQNRRAMVLHHLLENYRLTGLTDLWDRHHDDYIRVAEEIISDRHSTMVEVNGEKPLHWGIFPPEKPGVDVQAATQRAYVLGHSITNCQGLADLGRFLVITKLDPARGQRYLDEAADFRACIFRAMKGAAITLPDRPPFVDLQTLYFKETPDYGPKPYDDLGPEGRLQGTYYHYWVDMEFHYNFFNPSDEVAHWLADYVHDRNGFVLGLCRARNQWGNAKGWINNVYDGGYYNFRLRSDDINEFLLGFYSKLAFGMSRYTYVASEGSPFVGYNTADGGFVAANYSFPNSAANGDTLLMLRDALVMEELKDNVETGKLFLLKGTPRAWLAPGKHTAVRKLRTYFGDISFNIEAAKDTIVATIDPPSGDWKEIELSLRQPIQSATVNGVTVQADAEGKITIPHQDGKIVVEAKR